MDTRAEIIRIGDNLIRERGYNAFSFSDISKKLNIKNASVHYHFPTKVTLGRAIIQEHLLSLEKLKTETSGKSPIEQLMAFLNIYTVVKSENKVCLVGSLATDLSTVDPEIQLELKKLTDGLLLWVEEILQLGKKTGVFHFKIDVRTKALMIITNMLAAVQLTRLTKGDDFEKIQQNIIDELTQKTS